jgi:hypothetical protein
MTWLLASENLVFVAAGLLVFALLLLEVVGSLVAMSPGHAVDSLLGFDTDIDLDLEGADPLDPYHLGKVPLMVRLLTFLTLFCCCGLASQGVSLMVAGTLASSWWLGPAAAAVSFFVTRRIARRIATLLPSTETYAVSAASFIGKGGRTHGGEARRGLGAQLKLRDPHGRTHYLLVEPEGEEPIPEGTAVVVTAQSGARYLVRPHPEPQWVD